MILVIAIRKINSWDLYFRGEYKTNKELLEINKITFDSDEGWEEKKTTRS